VQPPYQAAPPPGPYLTACSGRSTDIIGHVVILHSLCRSSHLRPNPAVFGGVFLFLALALGAPCPALEELVVDLRVAGSGEGAQIEVLVAGPPCEVVPLRVGHMLSLLFPGRRPARGAWDPLPPLVASARVEEGEEGGRLLLDLAPGTGTIEIEAREGRLLLSLVPGEEPASQFFRPMRIGEAGRPAPRPSRPAPPPAQVPKRAPPPGPPPAWTAPAVPEPLPPPAAPAPPGPSSPPAAPARPAPSAPQAPAPSDVLPGWGLGAPDIGLEMRLIPLQGRRAWDKLPGPIRTHYHPMMAAARVAADSPYIFRFRQRQDRFRATLRGGRTVGSLDLRGREDMKFLSRGDAEALFDNLDLFPGSQHAGMALFPSTFTLEDVERMEVMIRGAYYEMPAITVGGD